MEESILCETSLRVFLHSVSVDLNVVKGFFFSSFQIDETIILLLEVSMIGSDANASQDDLRCRVSCFPTNIDRTID